MASTLTDTLVLSGDTESLAEEGLVAEWQQLTSRTAIARGWGENSNHTLVATSRAEAILDPALMI